MGYRAPVGGGVGDDFSGVLAVPEVDGAEGEGVEGGIGETEGEPLLGGGDELVGAMPELVRLGAVVGYADALP